MFTNLVQRVACGVAATAVLGLLTAAAWADDWPYPVQIHPTDISFDALVKSVNEAVEANGMFVVTKASASAGAKSRGVEIPGNMVLGVYRNDFAVRMLEASVPAGIEAPIRFYVTANDDGTATLTYQTPTAVFEPYGSADLNTMAGELDVIFAKIAEDAVK